MPKNKPEKPQMGNDPIYDAMLKMAAKRNIHVYEADFLAPDQFFGFYWKSRGRVFIAIERQMSISNKVFTLGHELGHYTQGDVLDKIAMVQFSSRDQSSFIYDPELEKAADQFSQRLVRFLNFKLQHKAPNKTA